MTVRLSLAHRDQWRQFDAIHGHDETMAAIARTFGAVAFDLYSMSLDWLHGDYALKCKGAKGDIVVVFS